MHAFEERGDIIATVQYGVEKKLAVRDCYENSRHRR